MSLARFAFLAAVLTLGSAALLAFYGIHDGDPRCPIDSVGIAETGFTECMRAVNPTDAPSSIEAFPASIDRKMNERGLVLAAGGLGAVFLAALGLRIVARDRSG